MGKGFGERIGGRGVQRGEETRRETWASFHSEREERCALGSFRAQRG